MSKHSKWETTRRAKAITDAKRAKIFTKIARNISVAVREGKSADPATNHKLRVAIEKAKQVNMPKSNIERAIASAAGGEGSSVSEIIYEIIGPNAVGILAICQTDNKNRLLGAVRAVCSKHNGSLAGENAVRWQFKQVGILTLETSKSEKLFLDAGDAGAEDVIVHDDGAVEVITPLDRLESIRQHLSSLGWMIQSAVPSFIPTTTIELEEHEYTQLHSLIDALEDIDEVNEVYTNGVMKQES